MRIYRDIINKISAAAFAAVLICFSGADAQAAELSLDFVPVASDGDRQYALEYQTAIKDNGIFDPRTMTPDSQVTVEFECEAQGNECPIELVWQSWGYHTTPVNNWSRIKAADYGDGYAVFNYADIVSVYGSDDFSEVYTVLVRDTGRSVTLKSVRITGLDIPGTEEETSQTAEGSAAEETEVSGTGTEESIISSAEISAEALPAEVTETSEDTSVTEEKTVPEEISSVTETEKAPEQKASGSGAKTAVIAGIIAAVAAGAGAAVIFTGKKRRKGNRFY